jgi:hypothetical protein
MSGSRSPTAQRQAAEIIRLKNTGIVFREIAVRLVIERLSESQVAMRRGHGPLDSAY